MERAKWNNQFYYASEISESYETEKSIRKASARKELICPDPDCTKPILRYCHGEIKEAFFAHLDNCDCDYAEFDKSNTQLMRKVKRTIYHNFISQRYDVKMEIKILSRHYTHLLFTLQNGKKLALELGTQKTTATEIDQLSVEYKKLGIGIKWIVINNENIPVKENKAFFLKRYLLNENKYKDALLLNWEGTEITQYVLDPNKYMFSGYEIRIDNYSDAYIETAPLTELTFEDEELTIKGFYKRYAEWLLKKEKAFKEKIAELEKELYEQEKRSKGLEKEREQLELKQTFNNIRAGKAFSIPKDNSIELNNIRSQMLNSKEPFYDTNYNKLRLCLHCDKVKFARLFDLHTFYEGNQNLGVCRECKKNNVPKKL